MPTSIPPHKTWTLVAVLLRMSRTVWNFGDGPGVM